MFFSNVAFNPGMGVQSLLVEPEKGFHSFFSTTAHQSKLQSVTVTTTEAKLKKLFVDEESFLLTVSRNLQKETCIMRVPMSINLHFNVSDQFSCFTWPN